MKPITLFGAGGLAVVPQVSAHDGLGVASAVHGWLHALPSPLLSALTAASVVAIIIGTLRVQRYLARAGRQ